MKRSFAWLILLASITAALGAAEVGQPAPDFTATDINGNTHKLSDYQGKIVILESYNLDCPFCHNHYRTGAMQDLQRDMTAKGIIFLVVNSVGPHNSSHRSVE